jgi:hypothetical protein
MGHLGLERKLLRLGKWKFCPETLGMRRLRRGMTKLVHWEIFDCRGIGEGAAGIQAIPASRMLWQDSI